MPQRATARRIRASPARMLWAVGALAMVSCLSLAADADSEPRPATPRPEEAPPPLFVLEDAGLDVAKMEITVRGRQLVVRQRDIGLHRIYPLPAAVDSATTIAKLQIPLPLTAPSESRLHARAESASGREAAIAGFRNATRELKTVLRELWAGEWHLGLRRAPKEVRDADAAAAAAAAATQPESSPVTRTWEELGVRGSARWLVASALRPLAGALTVLRQHGYRAYVWTRNLLPVQIRRLLVDVESLLLWSLSHGPGRVRQAWLRLTGHGRLWKVRLVYVQLFLLHLTLLPTLLHPVESVAKFVVDLVNLLWRRPIAWLYWLAR